MTNECNSVHVSPLGNSYRCNLGRDHYGDHLKRNTFGNVVRRWERTYAAGGYTQPQSFFITDAELKENKKYQDWLNKEMDRLFISFREPAKVPEETPVLLTLEDLKVIAYFMSVVDPESEDDVAVQAKIDAALKKML